jgi:NAD(P)-dependent dehydrogenase (short-subunit alcohol dehydrogenase family)
MAVKPAVYERGEFCLPQEITSKPSPTFASHFDLTGRTAVITGGAGLLGRQHAQAIASAGGVPVIVDLAAAQPARQARELARIWKVQAMGVVADITNAAQVKDLAGTVLKRFGQVDILINNAANNPKVEGGGKTPWSRLEDFPMAVWEADLAVGLTGAFLCSRELGSIMARQGRGVIINVASDLAIIAPDQRLYRRKGIARNRQPVKPVTYSVVKSGLLGLTRYLATYWADRGVRANAISPGGIYNGQSDEFVARLKKLIPMDRMARLTEYQAAMIFLCSDASSYMNGANLVIDGGRSCW